MHEACPNRTRSRARSSPCLSKGSSRQSSSAGVSVPRQDGGRALAIRGTSRIERGSAPSRAAQSRASCPGARAAYTSRGG
eukprot:scaffold282895_cov28-Tisochrysis_lutea.AAC.9